MPRPTLDNRLVALLLAVAAAAVLAGRAQAADAGALRVTFHDNHTITVTLDDRAVGTASGAATVIAAGSYTVYVDDTAAVSGPEFELSGPGVHLVTDNFFGESPMETYRVDLQPSSTYTWRNNERPGQVFVFATSSATAGSSGGGTSGGSSSGGTSTGNSSSTSKDVVGSSIVPFRGALSGDVNTAGKLKLVFKGKGVATLKAGRYRITVLDETSRSAFKLQKLGRQPVTLSGLAFVGKRSAIVTLKPGQWMFFSSPAKKHFFAVIA